MNDLLQKHGCFNVFTVPEGLKELMSDITREVLREQPKNICDFIYNYLSALLITREHGVMAVRILEDLCDCRPSVSEHLIQLGLEKDIANSLAQVIKDEIETFERKKDKEKIKEASILKKILSRAPLDEEMAAKVCQIARNAFKDYWYKKKLMEQSVTMRAEEPWEVAAERTLALYKKTKPSLDELHRATERIQAAYRGYYVRRNLLKHLKPKKRGPKKTLGAPLDIAGSREIDLGPVTDIQVREDDVNGLFAAHAFKLGPHYDSIKTTAIDNERYKNPLEKSPTYKMMDQKTGDQANRPVITTNPEVGIVQMESRRGEYWT
ncbi:unnamed protein product [Parnassius mnemosyne]|uniref:RIIa domain-containing protein n=1 Tax=Parnassius mnemosyne TaxID=213953 RepID=A0AAV1KG57_9NEOP